MKDLWLRAATRLFREQVWPAALQPSQEQDISLLQRPVRGRPRAPFGVSDGEPKKARGCRRPRVHLVTRE